MISTLIPSYVSKADSKEIVIEANEDSTARFLLDLGFHKKENFDAVFTITVSDDREKGTLFMKLRDEGICFSRGREWNPAEVFEWLRDEGLVTGDFQSIAWKNPEEWIVRNE